MSENYSPLGFGYGFSINKPFLFLNHKFKFKTSVVDKISFTLQ